MKYRITGEVTFSFSSIIEAKSAEEAEQILHDDRDIEDDLLEVVDYAEVHSVEPIG